MIRHFLQNPRQHFPQEIALLAFRMFQAPLPFVLVFAVVLTAFPPPALPTASRTAVNLTSLAATADKEHLPTERAKRPSENEWYNDVHVPTRRDWTKTAELWEAVSG